MTSNPYYRPNQSQRRAAVEDAGAVASGAMSGSQFGPIGAASGGALGLYSSTFNRLRGANELAEQDMNFEANYDINTDPTYQGSQITQANEQISSLQDAEQGLRGTGAKIGMLGIMPGLIAGGFSRRARRKLSNKQDEIRGQMTEFQNNFNQASQAFEQREIAQEQYRKRRNSANRLYNLYNAPGQQIY
jgi:hypothetical protein